MRLKYYLNEGNNNILDTIKNECKPFLNEFGNCYKDNMFIYRGMRDDYDDIIIKDVRTNRKPRLVTMKLHEYLSKIGKELFGWNIREEGVFAANKVTASKYGKPYIFIPIGSYKYVCINLNKSEIYSLYDRYDSYIVKGNLIEMGRNKKLKRKKWWLNSEEDNNIELQQIISILKKVETKIYDEYKNRYKKKGLDKLLKNNNRLEAIFKCKKYIAMTPKFFNENIKYIFEEL